MKATGLAAWGLVALLCVGPAAAQGKKKADNNKPSEVTLVCEASYQPARATWTRSVRIVYDKKRVRSVHIDGVPVYTFSVQDTLILTSIDNERIQIDTATQTWSSDFRGQATAQGRCERS